MLHTITADRYCNLQAATLLRLMATMASVPVGSKSLHLEILNRNNYKKWRLQLKTYFLSKDLWDVVEEITKPPKPEDVQASYKAWTKRNAEALHTIQISCGDEMFPFISETESAKTAWKALEQECKDSQEYDENNDDHLKCYKLFIECVRSGLWDKAKKCLGKIDVRSVVVRPLDKSSGYTALHVAAENGYLHIVKDLVQLLTQEDWKTKTEYGQTALHLAAESGHVYIVKVLPVALIGEVKDKDGDTALHNAVHAEKVDVMKELVSLMTQEDLQIKNNDGYTALHLAVNKGNMPMVKTLMTRAIGANNTENKNSFERYIPFTNYVESGDWDMAKECLGQLNDDPCGAVTAVDPRDEYGDTALHVAARNGHLEVLKGLLLLLKTREENHVELKTAQDYTTFGSGITLDVSEEIFMEKVKYMVEQYDKTLGSCLEIQNSEGNTALWIAVVEQNVDVVKELAPMMRQDGLELKSLDDGFSALHQAVLSGRLDVVEFLVPFTRKEGFEVQDNDGDTPLNCAVLDKNVDIIKALVRSMRPESFEIKNERGSTALHLAVKYGPMDVVRELIPLMRPAAFEEKDYENYTALSWAIQSFKDGDVCEIAKLMVARNENVLAIPSGPFDLIPVVDATNWSQWELGRYLYSVTPLQLLNGPTGSTFICHCLGASKQIDLALDLLERCPNLAMTKTTGSETSPMLKLSRLSSTFLSGCHLKYWQRWIYDRIHKEVAQVNIRETSINIAPSEEADHQNKRAFILSGINLFEGFVQGLRKLCGIHTLGEMKSTHKKVFEILRYMAEATKDYLSSDQLAEVKTSFFNAIQVGHFEFVTHICEKNPNIRKKLFEDLEVKGIFHVAIECRQKEVYSLIYELDEKTRHNIGIYPINEDYTLLHCAANLSSPPQSDYLQDASLQMQRELQWFKEVESIVPPEMYEHRDRSNDLTARELFTKNHKKLLEDAETSIKGTATSCTVVGALIVTMMFAAAFTVPGGNDGNSGLPLFLDHKLFKVYVVSDIISLVSSTSSVITFLGILTSRYAEDDFLISLPTKIMIGLITLFFSIVSMVIAFSCALILMHNRAAWIVILSIFFTSVPVMLFVWLLFPLLIKTFMSTYGPGIVDKKIKLMM